MNWITNFVRPKIRALYARKDVPENLWHKCPSCEAMLYQRELDTLLHVCPHCGFHMRVDAERRLGMLFDDGAYTVIELPKVPVDPLKFRDLKRYTDRLKEDQTKTGRSDALLVAHGSMGGLKVVVAAFDFRFMGGSMGVAVGEGLVAAARLAVLQEAPLIVVTASGGARMQEGILSLMQMPRTAIAVEMVKEKGLPYIVVLTDPTTGGVSASFAMLGDIHIAEPGAQIGFAGQRVIEGTVRETLPEGFQRAEYLLEHGMVDMVVHRRELRGALIRVLGLLCRPVLDRTVMTPEAAALSLPAPAGRDAAHGEMAKADAGTEPTAALAKDRAAEAETGASTHAPAGHAQAGQAHPGERASERGTDAALTERTTQP